MTDSTAPFRRFRVRAFIASGILFVVGLLGLLWIYPREPSSIPAVAAAQHGKIGTGIFGVLQTGFTTLLSIAVISLVFEVLLRESYAKDLLRFLRLRTALVTSGLQDISPAPDVEWEPILGHASRLTALTRDPSTWFDRQLPAILNACQKRATTVVVGLPSPDDPGFATIAASIGLSDDVLKQRINVSIDSARIQWQARKVHLHSGSSLRIVAYRSIPMYELVQADDQIVCMFGHSVGHTVGDYALVMNFVQDGDAYPAAWLIRSLAELATMNEHWAGDAK
jgi:hypothetical protein